MAAGPRLLGDSICADHPDEPFGQRLRVDGFGAAEQFSELVVIYGSNGSNTTIYAAQAAENDGTSILGYDVFDTAKAHRTGVLFFHDNDNSRTYNQGDDLITNQVLNINQPCTGTVGQPK